MCPDPVADKAVMGLTQDITGVQKQQIEGHELRIGQIDYYPLLLTAEVFEPCLFYSSLRHT